MKIKGYLIHCCALDPHCIKMSWRYGMPQRLHLGKRFWDIPGLTWLTNRRFKNSWAEAEPVRLEPRPEGGMRIVRKNIDDKDEDDSDYRTF